MRNRGQQRKEGAAHARASHGERERGAAVVEFAFVLPLLLVIMMGIITGGIGLNRNISINNAARESARYGATLPIDGDMTVWLNSVADVAIDAATGELDDGEPGRQVCVAYVHPNGVDPTDRTTRITVNAAGLRTVTVGNVCHVDGRPNDERRVQVTVSRTTDLEVVIWSRTVTIEGSSTARYERAGF
jgi:Flp pilus assembly protein TadG